MMKLDGGLLQILEVLVIAATTSVILIQVWLTFSTITAVYTIVCLSSQFVCLLINVLQIDQQPHIREKLFRSRADVGYLCTILVPLAVVADLVYITKHGMSINANYVRSTLGGCLFLSALASWGVTAQKASLKHLSMTMSRGLNYMMTAPALIAAGLLVFPLDFTQKLLVFLLSASVVYVVYYLPNYLPKTFTLGELSCVAQLSVVVAWRSICVFTEKDISNVKIYDTDHIHMIIYSAIAVIALLTRMVFLSRQEDLWVFYVVFAVVSAAFVIPAFSIVIGRDIVSWTILNVFSHRRRAYLLLYWLACSIFTGFVCMGRISEVPQSKTVIRKYFHLMIVAVYIPGLIMDAALLHMASVFAGAFLLLLEVMRCFSIPPLGAVIDHAFRMFVDDKDEGSVLVSHIYLLVGLSLPLWITSVRPVDGTILPVYSGVISIGVGDMAASIGGSLFGRHRWPGSNKTVEGTLACILSQLGAVYLLVFLGAVMPTSAVFLVMSTVLSSLFEAFTLQIDNLMLPLVTYILLCATA